MLAQLHCSLWCAAHSGALLTCRSFRSDGLAALVVMDSQLSLRGTRNVRSAALATFAPRHSQLSLCNSATALFPLPHCCLRIRAFAIYILRASNDVASAQLVQF
mmetsp:Transcript_10066/g.31988  ORF Transcript_10066/g.31988 Transcript_10066/m.31988 type:complete len:104 (-) Transcript_10066:568-879(-)